MKVLSPLRTRIEDRYVRERVVDAARRRLA
jgi:hypothetical protein